MGLFSKFSIFQYMETTRIHPLPEEVVNQIAAGEVVERPASAIKELIENALDAKATRIEIQITDGGKKSILVRDNGEGMNEADLNICYLPHTTSKLKSAEDLFHLATNGFRGEAIASIAAVSKLTITSRTADSAEAHSVHLIGGVPDSHYTDASPRGTSFFIEDLFFNAPVRKAFLGSDTLEASRILDTVTRLAIANPNVRFDYKVNGRDVFTGVEGNDLRSRIAEALGAGIAKDMVPVDYEEAGIRVSGFAIPPGIQKNKRSKLYFHVQKRPIWNPIMTKAVNRAYEPYGTTSSPIAVLFLEMADLDFDVNVHPNKREVRFANENDVFLAVHHAVRDAFQKPDEEHPIIRLEDIPAVPFHTGTSPEAPVVGIKNFKTERDFPLPTSELINESKPTSFAAPVQKAPPKTIQEPPKKYRTPDPDDIIQDLFSLPENGNIIPLTPQNLRPPTRIDKTPPPQFFQLANTYLVCEDSEGLLLIDQNAAHQRILYEQALDSLKSEVALESQELLFPEMIDVSAAEASVIPHLLPILDKLGFHLELFGKNTYQLRGIPRDLPFSRAVEALHNLFADVFEGENPENPSQELWAKAWAKSNAIHAGDKLSVEEMTMMMASLLATQDPMSSPCGRPTLMRLPLTEIHKRLKR